MSHPHPDLDLPAPLVPGGLRVIPLGGLGEVGRNMTVFEHDGQLLDRRLRRALPRGPPPRRRPDPPGLRLHRGPARRHRGARAHPRPRGPHRRGAVPAAGAPRHPARRLPADPRAARGQAAEHRLTPAHPGRRGGRPRAARPLRARVHRGQPLDPRRARRRDPHRRRDACCTPATSRWTSSRSTGGSPTCAPSPGWARRASTCSSSTPPTPRCRASRRPRSEIGPVLDRVFRQAERRIIVACFASHVHRVQQVLDAAVAHGRKVALRRSVDGAQHGHRRRPGLPPRPRRGPGRHQGAGRPARRPGGPDVARGPRASRWRRSPGWRSATTTSSRRGAATPSCSPPRSSPATRTRSTG